MAVQGDDGLTSHGGGVAHLLEERRLVVQACGQAQGDVVVPHGYDGQRGTWRHRRLAAERPVAEAHAVVQREEGLLWCRPAVGVLQVAFGASGVDGVLRRQRVDEVQTVAGVRYGVAAGVAHLVLAAVLLDVFPLHGDPRLQVVVVPAFVSHQLHALYVSPQVVAGVLHVSADTQVLRRLRVVEPVLALNVVGLLLLGVEGRRQQFYCGGVAEVAGYGEGAEVGAEDVALLSVEVDLERLHVLHRAEVRLPVLGVEVVMVAGDVTDEVDGPAAAGRPAHVCLVVPEAGVVLARRLQGAQQVAVGLVAQAVAHGEPW